MIKTSIRFSSVIFWFAIIVADIFIYMILGLLLMGYDDNYHSSKGAYWSLASMNPTEKNIYFALQVWNIVNIVAVIYIGYKLYKRQTLNKYK